MKKVNEVIETRDYNLFCTINGNRTLNQPNLKRLVKSMSSNYLMNPIIVNEKYQIIDGQHRFEVCKKLELPIRFILINGYGLDEVKTLNAISNNWRFDDFVQCYVQLGNPNYTTLQDFKNKYKLPDSITLNLLSESKGQMGSDTRLLFNNGKFKVKNLKKAEELAEKINKVHALFDKAKSTTFLKALLKAMKIEDFKITIFISKLKMNSAKMVHCTNEKDYLKVMEDIYNYKNRNKIRLF